MPEKIITTEQLMERLPEEYRPIVTKYGPLLLDMTVIEIWDWIELIASGNTDEAYQTLVSRMDNSDMIAELDKINNEWAAENKDNAQRLALQRNASLAVLRVTLQMALALVGL